MVKLLTIAKLRIKEVRTDLKISQKKLAKNAKISQGYLSELENNRKNPTLKMICKISDALQIEPSEIISFKKCDTV